MDSALDESVVQIEELILLPFQVGTGMRAFIQVGIVYAILMDYKDTLCLAFNSNLKSLAAGIRNLAVATEHGFRFICHDDVC